MDRNRHVPKANCEGMDKIPCLRIFDPSQLGLSNIAPRAPLAVREGERERSETKKGADGKFWFLSNSR